MLPATLDDINQTLLTPIVRSCLGSNSAEITSWQIDPILQGRASPAGVYKVRGTVDVQGESLLWSLVLKELHAKQVEGQVGYNETSDDQTRFFYWKRELLLYQSGLFEKLPKGFAAPRCYQIDLQPGSGRIWMENVADEAGPVWSLEQYAVAARHLGRFNGSYLTRETMPTWPWLFTKMAERRIDDNDWPQFRQQYATLREKSDPKLFGWTDELAADFEAIWQARDLFVAATRRVTQTLAHNDAGRRNLMARRLGNGEWETVAVDWGTIGTGPLGEDLACLVAQAYYWFGGVPPEQIHELDALTFAAYIQGLREVGWQGDEAEVRLGYTASFCLRIFGIFIIEYVAQDENLLNWITSAMGHTVEEITDMQRHLRPYVVECANEARRLMALGH